MAHERRTAAAYDIVAADDDDRFRDELARTPRDRAQLDELAARASGVVLDVGSGPGHIGARIRAAGRPVFAIDLSGAMAHVSKEATIRDDMIGVAHRAGASLRQLAEVSGSDRKTVTAIVGTKT